MLVNGACNISNLSFLRRIATILLLAGPLLASNTPVQAAVAASQGEPSYAALADLLENQQARQRLIDQLRSLAQEGGGQAETAGTAAAKPPSGRANKAAPSEPATSDRLASGVQRFTETLADDLSQTAAVAASLLRGDATLENRISQWRPALKSLFICILTVLAVYALLRLLAALGFARLNAWVRQEEGRSAGQRAADTPGSHTKTRVHRLGSITLGRKLLGAVGALIIDVAATLLAALAGYVAVVILAEQSADVSSFAILFLSTFVLIEIIKAISRGIFATRYEKLRLLPLAPETASYWNHWIAIVVGFSGYGLMVAVPVVQTIFLASAGQLLGLLIMAGVYIYAVRVIWTNRAMVKKGLIERAEKSNAAVFSTLIRVLAKTWHLIALAYFTVLLVVSQIEQQQTLFFMARATGQSLLAMAAGLLLAATLTSLESRRMRIPDDWRDALPLLESRLNAYVPAFLKGLRLLVLAIVTLVVLDAWHAFNLVAWVESDSGRAAIAMLIHVGIILAFAALAWTVLASIIEHRLGAASEKSAPTEREKTLLMLFRNAAAVVIATMTILVVLSQIGINIGPLIAGAGVAGLAIGFGAQKLVQDVITGVFIQLENGMNTNDVVELCGLFGTVEKITIRSVALRTMDGGYHMIPFSTIDKLTNHTRDYGYHYGEYTIAHRESVDEAIAELRAAFQELMQDPELSAQVLDDISIPGVTSLSDRGFTIRVLIKTTPGNQWAIQRGFNRLVKKHFDAAGIELPYPQAVIHFGRNKDGYAAPVDIRGVDSLKEVAATKPGFSQSSGPALRTDS